MSNDSARLKIDLLSHGIGYDDAFLAAFETQTGLLEKRRAYGTGDGRLFARSRRVPQEIVLEGGVVCAVNFNAASPWRLSFEGSLVVLLNEDKRHVVSLPPRPAFYGLRLASGRRVEEIVTLYGTGTLGIFSLGHCYYFNDSRECKFCSLGPARDHVADHLMKVQQQEAREAVAAALSVKPDHIRHVLLNGGTAREYNKAFSKMAGVLSAALDAPGAEDLEGHMISMPPRDFGLFELVAQVRATLAMSLEVWDPELFSKICPGKDQDYGRRRFLDAYEAAVVRLGHGNVYAGFVAGLEPVTSLIEGMRALANIGVVPAVAVFHPDAGSKFARRTRPKTHDLLEIGREMSALYAQHGFRPLITGSGRNSLDTEAYNQQFT